MCFRDCQTFLWGGTGISMVDADGGCTCSCEGEGWSEYNILGVPSCVPLKAHELFGVLGVVFAMASLCHAGYHFFRQVKFHQQRHIAVSSSPIEKCRRDMHIVVIIHSVVTLCYFIMVIFLEKKQLWISAILLAGAIQFTIHIAGVLTVRMWIYCNDPRLIRETPEILALSNMLERPVGRYTSHGVTCIALAASTTLAATRYSERAIKVASVAFLGLIAFASLTVLKCGKSLVRTINSSLQNATERSKSSGTSASAAVGRKDLLAARRKIKIAVCICLVVAVQTFVLLMVAVCTTYGTSAPILLFGIPHGYSSFAWFAFNVQLHAGRSNHRGSHGSAAGANGPEQGASGFISRVVSMVKIGSSALYFPTRAANSRSSQQSAEQSASLHSSEQSIIPVETFSYSGHSIVPVEAFT